MLIVTSNYLPEQCFRNREDIAPILRRFRVVQDLSELPPIPEVQLGMLEALEGMQQEVPGEVQEPEEGLQEVQEAGEAPQEVGEVPQEVQGAGEVQPNPDPSLELDVQVGEEEVEEEDGQQDHRCNQQ